MRESKIFDIAIVGGGIVGLASAFKLQKKYPHLSIAVLEKEEELAFHQTGRNSGVIHSGLYYRPGSFRATNCVNGRKQLVAFAEKHQIDHEVCGKIVVATREDELVRLNKIRENGLQNGLKGIEIIDSEQIIQIEPFIKGIKALWVPESGIIDFKAVTIKLAELIKEINPISEIITSCKVKHFDKGETSQIYTSKGLIQSRYIVFCAGLHSDRMARKDQIDLDMRIVGFRGDYYDLTPQGKKKIKNLVYPVPNPEFPFLGVHFTRMTDGTIECGPNAVFTFKREGYGKTDFNFRDTLEALLFSGTWKLFFKQWRFGLDEYKRAFSKRLFLNQLQRMCPSLTLDDIVPGRSGVRAMALGDSGDVIDDFKIEYKDRSIHVLNAPSPAATACLAIGDEVMAMAETHFSLD
ncbi:MAG: L-2-hydroxyglutarate oxidase [Flavobacteriales bacterium]|nr:L-2-hydroxyglutarate oxidase [Flavobacteriales bacterium]|tara:strand:+ start:637 stop:1857 length:1221 start_codon:yes stop_codon:yes gene_type:complete